MPPSSYGRTASGLHCSWGSKLDETVPRAKMPKCALPPDVRAKMGLRADPSIMNDEKTVAYFKQPGFGVQKQKGSDGPNQYSAGNQKHFLKKHSGVPMSIRTAGGENGAPLNSQMSRKSLGLGVGKRGCVGEDVEREKLVVGNGNTVASDGPIQTYQTQQRRNSLNSKTMNSVGGGMSKNGQYNKLNYHGHSLNQSQSQHNMGHGAGPNLMNGNRTYSGYINNSNNGNHYYNGNSSSSNSNSNSQQNLQNVHNINNNHMQSESQHRERQMHLQMQKMRNREREMAQMRPESSPTHLGRAANHNVNGNGIDRRLENVYHNSQDNSNHGYSSDEQQYNSQDYSDLLVQGSPVISSQYYDPGSQTDESNEQQIYYNQNQNQIQSQTDQEREFYEHQKQMYSDINNDEYPPSSSGSLNYNNNIRNSITNRLNYDAGGSYSKIHGNGKNTRDNHNSMPMHRGSRDVYSIPNNVIDFGP